jgi:nucleotide-binding universal stress UspA family protein
MGFKDILVHLDGHRGSEKRLQLAVSIARQDKAHLVGIYGFELPRDPFPNIMTEAYAENPVFRTAYERERDAAFAIADQIEATFRAETKRAGLTADWRLSPAKTTDLVTMVTEQAHYADLVVLGQADPDHPLFDRLAKLPETVMMGCGRPVLIVPYAGRIDTVGKTVLVAWNGTREAARAVADALPLLRSAEAVTVVSIGPTRGGTENDDKSATGLASHLARHDIHADALHLASDHSEASDLILSRAKDLGCDLIVMGGYGHSRTRELILGGVTRGVLQHMTVPVLMSH